MKASEADRIQGLLAARRPPVTYEAATIDGVRMLVIIGKEVDTVIRFSRGGSADMPQVCSYPEVAESAVYADQRLFKQRAPGRRNTTGEGRDWPHDWKLDKAKAAQKIWYAESRPNRLPSKPCSTTQKVSLSHAAPTAEELRNAHEEYRQTVSNNYATTIRRVGAALSSQKIGELAEAISDWLKSINEEYYKHWHPKEAATLAQRLMPILREELDPLMKFRQRGITTLEDSDRG